MLGAVAALDSQEGVEIEDAECVAVSFPGFFDLLDSLRVEAAADAPSSTLHEGAAVIVAIDGPAGAGKSSVARALALRLGFRYLDTGAMYRALTWLAQHSGVELDDVPALVTLAREHPVEFGDGGGVFIAGHDVTAEIRSPVIDSLGARRWRGTRRCAR